MRYSIPSLVVESATTFSSPATITVLCNYVLPPLSSSSSTSSSSPLLLCLSRRRWLRVSLVFGRFCSSFSFLACPSPTIGAPAIARASQLFFSSPALPRSTERTVFAKGASRRSFSRRPRPHGHRERKRERGKCVFLKWLTVNFGSWRACTRSHRRPGITYGRLVMPLPLTIAPATLTSTKCEREENVVWWPAHGPRFLFYALAIAPLRGRHAVPARLSGLVRIH